MELKNNARKKVKEQGTGKGMGKKKISEV